jgi:hypothetical protein
VSRARKASVLYASVLGVSVLAACAGSSSPPDEIVITPGTPAAQGDPGGPAVAAPPTTGCEDFGALSGTSLTAITDTSGTEPLEQTTFSVAGRPVATKVRVVASGDPTTLVGRTAVLGADVNVSFSTCTHCLLVAVGCTGSDCSSAALFFPRAGSATLTSVGEGPGQTFSGTFDNVELEQVTIDPVTLLSSPVPGGACIKIPTLAFSAQTPGGDGGYVELSPDGGTTDDGGGGGSHSGGGGGGGGKAHAVF